MDFLLPSLSVYGFGERISTFKLGQGAWGMWSTGVTDQTQLDTGRGRGGQYGVHPFLLVRTREAQKYIGMYFRNANAQLPVIRQDGANNILSYITLGGQIEVYFFISGTAKEVVQDFHRFFGKPHLPPFWALGWQEASQTTYEPNHADANNQLNLLNTVKLYREQGFPLEAVYLDESHLSNETNFQLNPAMIPDPKDLKEQLSQQNVKLVAFLDPTIYAPEDVSNRTKNQAYVEGNKRNLFIKSSMHVSKNYSNNLVAAKGLKKCVYIDWFKVGEPLSFWERNLQAFHKIIDFDGVWTTNNEAYTDIQGELFIDAPVKLQEAHYKRFLAATNDSQYDTTWFKTFEQKNTSTYYLPFIPSFAEKGPYDNYSISLNATHQGFVSISPRTGAPIVTNETEYNLHSLYGHAMIQTTYEALTLLANSNSTLRDKRNFIVTRSTFTGTNQYASYPIRYRYRTWQALQQAIPHVMSMNMFGFTHTGVDACGTIDMPGQVRSEMDEELCLRWIQLQTFFPLARHSQNFNRNDSYLTGPLGFKEGPRKNSLMKTMRDRMQYLRFMYTCLFEASQWGGSCIDPIYFHFTKDLKAMEEDFGANDTFIFGGAVKVSPILRSLKPEEKTFKSHFPQGRWLNLATASVLDVKSDGEVDLDATQDTVNVHLRPGSIIPIQSIQNANYSTTEDIIQQPISIVINRNDSKAAKGTLLLDDGISRSELINKTYEYYSIEHKAPKSIQFSLLQGLRDAQDDRHHLDRIVIGDAEDLSTADFACAYTTMNEIIKLEVDYFNDTKVLHIFRPSTFNDTRLQFSKVSNVFYGTNGKDLNLCSSTNYEYMVHNWTDVERQLNSPEATMRLIHKAGVLPDLNLTVRMFSEGIVNVKWTWLNTTNGKRQHPEIPDILVNSSKPSVQGQEIGRHIIIQQDPFMITFYVQQGQTAPLFEIDRFIYDSYVNWVGMTALTTMKGDNYRGVLGLGERSSDNLFFQDGIYSMWAYDEPTKNDQGDLPGRNGYGVHPFFMFQHSDKKWVGVFSKQAAAQDWIIKNYPKDGKTYLKQVSTGAISDFYIIINSETPDSVVAYYQRIVGKPVLMPQWTLGWHQCKYCLRTVDEYKEVVDNYKKYNIPLDAQWADIDYMHNYQNFVVDELYFGDLKSYVDNLYHNQSLKFVPIVDPSIAVRQNYSTYQRGEQQNVFFKSAADSSKTFIGKGWANDVAFPDFFAPNAVSWWHNELTEFRKNQVWFDGLWLDMNEASNFCNGACLERQKTSTSVSDLFYYNPTGRSLESKSLPIDLVHANPKYTQLDTHSYFGAHQIAVTHSWFKENSPKRPFIVGRSTFAGSGKYAGKWLGDSGSSANDMKRSVTGSMMMNIFGIPFVGGDICGFMGENSSPELCTRWHQVGAFQPFSRNHRDCDGHPQEPYRFINHTIFNNSVTLTHLMRKAILEKYSLIRYYYTHLFLLSQDETSSGAFYKPVFFEFPLYAGAYRAHPSENVMLGPSLKLSIKTSPNKNWEGEQNDYFFPKGKWCDILHPESECVYSQGDEMQFQPASLKDYQLHLRDGHIVPFQNASSLNITRSEDLQKYPVDFHINPSNMTQTARTRKYQASGLYVNDNGTTTNQNGTYNKYQISFTYNDIVDGDNDDETVTLRISAKDQATAYYSNETRCSTINENDILGDLYIYDEYNMFQRTQYAVMLLRTDGQYDYIGVARFDPHTSRMIYLSKGRPEDVAPVCLSNIEEIIFTGSVA